MTEWLAPDEPAHYCIKVQGHVRQQWADNIGFSIDYTDVIGEAISVLRGPVVDQAALMGVIGSLYTMGFPLLSVECEESAEAGSPGARSPV